jgi:hypothetical protein
MASLFYSPCICPFFASHSIMTSPCEEEEDEDEDNNGGRRKIDT